MLFAIMIYLPYLHGIILRRVKVTYCTYCGFVFSAEEGCSTLSFVNILLFVALKILDEIVSNYELSRNSKLV